MAVTSGKESIAWGVDLKSRAEVSNMCYDGGSTIWEVGTRAGGTLYRGRNDHRRVPEIIDMAVSAHGEWSLLLSADGALSCHIPSWKSVSSRLEELRVGLAPLQDLVDVEWFEGRTFALRADGVLFAWSRDPLDIESLKPYQGRFREIRGRDPAIFARLDDGTWTAKTMDGAPHAERLLAGYEKADDLVFRQQGAQKNKAFLTVRMPETASPTGFRWTLLRLEHDPLPLPDFDRCTKVFPGPGYVIGMEPVE